MYECMNGLYQRAELTIQTCKRVWARRKSLFIEHIHCSLIRMDSDSYVDISTNSAKILEIYKKAAIVAKGR